MGLSFSLGYIKVDGVSSVFCFIWGWEEPAWGLPFQFHGGECRKRCVNS